MNTIRAVVDEPTRSSNDRVYAEHESLDATFALLDDVRTRSFALQQRLRNSLPVRWSSNALVMQRSTVEQHSEWDVERHTSVVHTVAASSQRHTHKDARRPAKEGLHAADSSARAPLIDELDWSRQRYRRKVEWDVAKRIARIDRELTSLPPGQRFWNKKRAHEHRQQQLARQEELSRTRVLQEARVKAHDVVSEYGTPRKTSMEKSLVNKTVTPEARRSLSRVAPHGKENAQPHYEKQTMASRVTKPVDRAPLRSSIDSSAEKRKPIDHQREKENQPPKQPKAEQKATSPATDSVPDPQSSSVDLVATSEELSKATSDQELPVREEELVVPVKNKAEDKLARETFLDLDEPTEAVHSHDDQREQSDRQRHSRPVTKSEYQQQTSSVGRQVLSDYRNAPAMALYGPPAVTGDRRNRKLNSDVLRRLFSDLDSDRDGHLNRIETCMALHRLQIAVPATRIATFFRRVYAAEVDKPDTNHRGSSNSNRAALRHQPLKEVINYKQFVAFVTAANELSRQDLQQIRPEPSHQQQLSTSRPRPVNSLPPTQFSVSISTPLGRGNALYELDTNEEADGLEQSVLKSIPDYLISRLLADEPSRDGSSNKTVSVVRKSLEKLLPRDFIDEKMVQEIARELVREHLENRISPPLMRSDEEEDDSSGLSRAAAYFNKQSTLVDMSEESHGEEREVEDLDSWLDLLTEEQVAALVQEILKEKAPTLLLQPDRVAKDEPEEMLLPPLMLEVDADSLKLNSQKKGKDDKQTDTQDFLVTHIQLVAEKEVQVGGAEEDLVRVVAPDSNQKIQVSGLQFTTSGPRRLPMARTNLAKAVVILASPENPDCEIAAVAQRRLPPTSMSIIQQLRTERKRFCRVPPTMSTTPAVQTPERAQSRVLEDRRRPTKLAETRRMDRLVCVDSLKASSETSGDFSRRTSVEALEMDQSVDSSDAFPKFIEKKLFTHDISHQGSFKIPSRSSSSASSSDFSSSGDSRLSLFSDFTIAANKSLEILSTRRNQQRNKWVNDSASTSSSCRKSLASEDFSEGEIETRASLDLSDGEIVGTDRKRVVMQKNAANRFCGKDDQFESSCDELNDTRSSIESGELLPIAKLRSTYRQRVLDLSISSAESGELEDGLLE